MRLRLRIYFTLECEHYHGLGSACLYGWIRVLQFDRILMSVFIIFMYDGIKNGIWILDSFDFGALGIPSP
jgi:hypothetical protein